MLYFTEDVSNTFEIETLLGKLIKQNSTFGLATVYCSETEGTVLFYKSHSYLSYITVHIINVISFLRQPTL